MADTTQMAVAKGMLTVDEQNRFTDRLITLMDNDEELSMILEGHMKGRWQTLSWKVTNS